MPSNKTLQFSSTLEKSDNNLWGCHFPVPDSVAKELIVGRSRRVFCSLNGAAEHQCALLPHGGGSFVISVNKKLQASLHLKTGMDVDVVLRRDTSKYGLPIPEEFRELLMQDKEGDHLFHSLTAGRQRTLLYIIGSAKGSDNTIKRAITVLNHLKSNQGTINYKKLNEAIRKDTSPNRKRLPKR